ncbi:MAG: hypothetical protein NTU79_24215 [Planctomycetota bacterium]|nr:hypothetical protein [Planctomycetota bacterium]
MPAIANSTQAPKRATFAKTLTRLYLGLSLAAGVLYSPPNVLGQQCDRCASLQPGTLDPSCGCEPSVPAGNTRNRCTVQCVPKPSFAEKFLKRMDELGDSMEARSMQSCRQCNSINVRSNSDCTRAPAPASTGWQDRRSNPEAAYLFKDNPKKQAIGSLSDQHAVPPIIETPIAPSTVSPQASVPAEKAPANKSIGLKTLPTPPVRLPADEQAPFSPTPSNALPGLDKASVPDVLIDPFKDDVSAARSLRKRGVSLTSDTQSAKSFALVRGKKPLNEDSVISQSDAPAKLTAEQRTVPSIQFEAMEPVATTSNEAPAVEPTSFWDSRPIVISPRRDVRSTDQENAPNVRRMQVPQKR